MKKQYKYDFVLSFAGEDREIVEEVKRVLEQNHFKVFYDFDEQEVLLGKDLAEYFSKLYQEEGKYCAMFISKHYISKPWTRWERKAAIARAFKSRKEYILPYFLDNSKLLSIPETIGRANFPDVLPKEFAKILIKKYLREFNSVEIFDGIFLRDAEKTKGLSVFYRPCGNMEYPAFECGVGLNVSVFNSTDEKIKISVSSIIENDYFVMSKLIENETNFDRPRLLDLVLPEEKIMPHTAKDFFFRISGVYSGRGNFIPPGFYHSTSLEFRPAQSGTFAEKYGPPKIQSIFPEQTEYSIDFCRDTFNSLSRNNFEIFNNVRFIICIGLFENFENEYPNRFIGIETIIYENKPRFMNITEV